GRRHYRARQVRRRVVRGPAGRDREPEHLAADFADPHRRVRRASAFDLAKEREQLGWRDLGDGPMADARVDVALEVHTRLLGGHRSPARSLGPKPILRDRLEAVGCGLMLAALLLVPG